MQNKKKKIRNTRLGLCSLEDKKFCSCLEECAEDVAFSLLKPGTFEAARAHSKRVRNPIAISDLALFRSH
jgi:hypothetical protein